MLAVLTKTIDPIRAFELADFLVLFLLISAAVTTTLFVVFLVRARTLRRELQRSSEEVYYNLLPSLALNAEEHGLLKRLAVHLTPPQQRHRLVTNPQVFAGCAARFLREAPGEGAAVTRLQTKLGFLPAAGDKDLRPAVKLPRHMRREHLRQRVQLPVAIRVPGGAAKPLESALIELSGGGASLRNPENRFKAQDRLELTFSPDAQPLTVPARVLRTSRNGAVLHVRFDGLPPSSRERIVLLLRKLRNR